MKVCIIGAGSPYTPELIERLSLYRDRLPVSEIALMDIDAERLTIMAGFCSRFAEAPNFPVTLTSTTDRAEAISGSRFVNTQIRVGGNRARIQDERIPLSMGLIGQETTGAGGFAKALRTLPVMVDIARDVVLHAPEAWIVNYTNPTGLVTEAVLQHTKARIAGLCAGGLFAQNWTGRALGVEPSSVRYDIAGLNHMNFSYNITVNGRPLRKEEFLLAAREVGSVDPVLIETIGALPSPYLQYYYHTARKLLDFQKAGKTRGEEVLAMESEIYEAFADPAIHAKPEILKKRGGGGYAEVAVGFMDAVHNNKDTWMVVNTPNCGTLSFLPNDAVIETGCLVNASGIHPLAVQSPPRQVCGLIAAVKNYEQLAVEAAMTSDQNKALAALMAHPLVRDGDVARILLDKLLEANRIYLPEMGGVE